VATGADASRRLIAALEAFFSYDEVFPPRSMLVFLLVAQHDPQAEPLTRADLIRRAGLPVSTGSRAIDRLMGGFENGGRFVTGLDLIQVGSGGTRLTDTGERLWYRLQRAMGE
jgi:hypothetical protein